jgi:glycine/D-amino acid oxidase-like deaminating enzyme
MACRGQSYQQCGRGVSQGGRTVWLRRVSPGQCLKVSTDVARAGSFKRPLFKDDGSTCIGVETVNGAKYYADKVILAAGAWSPVLVDLEDQCCSKVRNMLDIGLSKLSQ